MQRKYLTLIDSTQLRYNHNGKNNNQQTLMKKSNSSRFSSLSTSWILVVMAKEKSSLCTSNNPTISRKLTQCTYMVQHLIYLCKHNYTHSKREYWWYYSISSASGCQADSSSESGQIPSGITHHCSIILDHLQTTKFITTHFKIWTKGVLIHWIDGCHLWKDEKQNCSSSSSRTISIPHFFYLFRGDFCQFQFLKHLYCVWYTVFNRIHVYRMI